MANRLTGIVMEEVTDPCEVSRTDFNQDFAAINHIDLQTMTTQHAHPGEDIAFGRQDGDIPIVPFP